MRKIIAVDTETTGLYTWKGHRPFLVSACDEKLRTEVYDLRDDPKPAKLVKLLADPKVDKLFHNVRFDVCMLAAAGFEINGELHDTMAAYRLAYQMLWSIALDSLAKQFLSMDCPEDKAMDGARKKIARESHPRRLMEDVLFSEVPREIIYPYARADVKRTMMLWQQIFPDLEEHWALYRNEVDLWRVTAAMEARGVLVDAERAKREYGRERAAQHHCAGRVKKFLDAPRLNLNSPKQVALALGKVVDLTYFKASGAAKTSDDALQRYKHPAAKLILEFRKHDKLAGTYYGPIGEKLHEGVLHAGFMAQGARTGRFSSRGPNFQNLPKSVRSIILPRPGFVFLSADYRQIELRIVAHYAKCQKLIEAFKIGRDPHTENCMLLFGDTEEAHRKVAKCIEVDTPIHTGVEVRPVGSMLQEMVQSRRCGVVANGQGRDLRCSVGSYPHKEQCVAVVTKRAVLVCSPTHRLQTLNDGLVEAANLKVGTQMPTAVVPQLCYDTAVTLSLSPFTQRIGDVGCRMTMGTDWAYFAGMFQGDGHRGESTVGIAHGHTRDYAAWRKVLWNACRAVGLAPRLSKNNKLTYLGSRRVAAYFEQLGLLSCRSKILRVPPWVFAGGQSVVWSYIAGLFDTDGTVAQNVNFTTKDPVFAGQVAFLLRSLGCVISIDPGWNKTYRRYYCRVNILGRSLAHFSAHCPLRSEQADKLRRRVLELCGKFPREAVDVVKAVYPVGEHVVCDLHVDSPTHTYLQGGLIGHNSVNFAFVYGVGVRRLQDMVFPIIGTLSTEDAQGFLVTLRQAYPEIAHFRQTLEAGIRTQGFMETAYGRVFPECREVLKDCINFEVQSTAADTLKHAMTQVHEPLLKAGAHIVATIHDELVIECPEKKQEQVIALLHKHMTSTGTPSGVKWLVPLPIEIKRGVKNWAEQEKLDGDKWKHLADMPDEPEVIWTDAPIRRIVLPGRRV